MERLNWGYNSIALYSQALTHTSYAHENNGDVLHNERLEFLGDAVLELIVSDYLYNFYGNLPEGELTRLRADLVCESSLSRLALWFNIGEFLLLGKGEKAHGGASRPSILADVVEALIGALYLDVAICAVTNMLPHYMSRSLRFLTKVGCVVIIKRLFRNVYNINTE